MRFSRIDGLDVVTRITGPIHHFLGIEFGRGLAREARVERVDSEGTHHEVAVAGSTPPDVVRREVARGVLHANKRLGSKLSVRVIRYCTDDPVVPGIYEKLAEALSERVFMDEAASRKKSVLGAKRKRTASMIPLTRLVVPRTPTSSSPSTKVGATSEKGGLPLYRRNPLRFRSDSLLQRYRLRLLVNSLSHVELKQLEKELERSKQRKRSPAK